MPTQKLNKLLIQQCRKQDRKAIQELYFLLFEGFMRIVSPYVSDNSEAKSIVNDAFIKLLSKLGSIQNIQAFPSWANKIVRNTAIDSIRKNANYKSKVRLEDYDENRATFSDDILQELNGQDLLKMIQTLQAKERLVFTLFFVEEFSHKEIAQELEISTEMSRWLLYKAKKNFKKIYIQMNRVSMQMR